MNSGYIVAAPPIVASSGRPNLSANSWTNGFVKAYCVGCHKMEGDGGTDGPDLTHEGTKHDAATLRLWIVDPEQVDPNADMPSFGDRLSAEQLDAISGYLASRR